MKRNNFPGTKPKIGTGTRVALALGGATLLYALYRNHRKKSEKLIKQQEERLADAANEVGFEEVIPENKVAFLESLYKQILLSPEWDSNWLDLDLAVNENSRRLHVYETVMGQSRFINFAFEVPKACYKQRPSITPIDFTNYIREFINEEIVPIFKKESSPNGGVHFRMIGQFIMDYALVCDNPEDMEYGQLRVTYPRRLVTNATQGSYNRDSIIQFTRKFHNNEVGNGDLRSIENCISENRGAGEKCDIIDAIAYAKYSFPIGTGKYVESEAMSKIARALKKMMDELVIGDRGTERYSSLIVYENPWLIENEYSDTLSVANSVRVYAPKSSTVDGKILNFVDIDTLYLMPKEDE